MATLLTKKSDTASSVPLAGDLTNAAGGAELAVNTADKKLYVKNSSGTVVELTGLKPTDIGVSVQAYDAELSTLAGMSSSRATYLASTEGFGFRNRIINGDMRIDQRNAGASVAVVNNSPKYGPDRFQLDLSTSTGVALSIQQVSDAPADFGKSLKVTVTTSGSTSSGNYSYVRQLIEGYNFADLNFGTANAKTFTLSFWVKSSLTGTFGGYLGAALNARFRTFSYTINSANTWEYKTVTVSGDTAGTWDTTNGVGLQVAWSMSCGSTYQGATGSWGSSLLLGATGQVNVTETNGATFYITGVQLEAGSVASPFERRDYGRELMMCQRYCLVDTNESKAYISFATGGNSSSTASALRRYFPVTMRSAPTLTVSSTTAFLVDQGNVAPTTTNITLGVATASVASLATTVASGLTAGFSSTLVSDGTTSLRSITYSAEL